MLELNLKKIVRISLNDIVSILQSRNGSNHTGIYPGAQGCISPGGDPKCLIFGSFDQAKERTRENNAVRLENTKNFNRALALCFFFFLDEKETKNQERLIARPRTRSAQRTWAMILPATLAFG